MNIIIILTLTLIVESDPQPTGGAKCKNNDDCGGIDGGFCRKSATGSTGYCVCKSSRANPDCSYIRKSKELIGGLQILSFFGIAGIGNFVAGFYKVAVAECIVVGAIWTINILALSQLLCGVQIFINNEENKNICRIIVMIIVTINVISLIYYLVSVILTFAGNGTDVNGYDYY